MAREAMDIRLRVLKKSNTSRFDSYSVKNSELIASHITFRDCRVHIFSDNLPRNSRILYYTTPHYTMIMMMMMMMMMMIIIIIIISSQGFLPTGYSLGPCDLPSP